MLTSRGRAYWPSKPSMRAHFLRVALSEAVPPRILERMREIVRAVPAREDEQRLREKGGDL
jgi:hypothetical protein